MTIAILKLSIIKFIVQTIRITAVSTTKRHNETQHSSIQKYIDQYNKTEHIDVQDNNTEQNEV